MRNEMKLPALRLIAGILFLLMVCAWVFDINLFLLPVSILTVIFNVTVIFMQNRETGKNTKYTNIERIPYILAAIVLIIYGI